MRITSSYGVEIRKQNSALAGTVRIYREAVRYLILYYESAWDELAPITEKHRRFNYAEHLVHNTKKNLAACDFDEKYPKMPSYLRRSAITHALGAVSSFRSHLALWEQNGRTGKKPVLGEKTFCMPVFYRDNMYREPDGDYAELKVYEGKDWVWRKVSLLHTDMEYLRKDADLMADKAAGETEALKILRMLNKAAAAGQTIYNLGGKLRFVVRSDHIA